MLFIPIGDENPTRTTPVVTYALVALNVLVFLYANVALDEPGQAEFFQRWAYSTDHPVSIQLVSCLFVHAGFAHIFGNLLMLWIMGDNVEDKLGPVRFLLFYLAAGVAATWAFTAASGLAASEWAASEWAGSAATLGGVAQPHSLVGASGAIAGVMGVYLVFFPEARIKMLAWFFLLVQILYIRAKWVIGMWLAIDVIRTAYAGGGAFDGVATAAHVGGGVFGILLGLTLKRRLGGSAAGSAWDVHTGFAKTNHSAGSRRLVDTGEQPGWFTPPEPPEADLIHLEIRLVQLVERGRIREAIDLYPRYEALARERPLPGHVQIEIAHEFYEQGLWENAVDAYERYLETEPSGRRRGEAKFRLGVLLGRHLGRTTEAVGRLTDAAREHPDPAIRRFASEEIIRLRR